MRLPTSAHAKLTATFRRRIAPPSTPNPTTIIAQAAGSVGGHALLLADIDGDGISEIIAGGARMRDMYYYKATDATLKSWTRYLMDNNEAAASCAVADIKGVGKAQDVVCIEQSKPSRLKWYEYQGK